LRCLKVEEGETNSITSANLFVSFTFLAASNANSQEFSDAEIRNIGSGAAVIMLCEKEGYIPTGSSSEYLKAIKRNVPKLSGELIIKQYQNSLHDKKLYSIAKDKWIPITPNKKDCADMFKVYPSALYHFKFLNN
jgi:hypothetical protein